MSGLPREVLKWLQSLDLSYSVKNVRRDFSNGFLIAEIFSRFYPQDIQMHAFNNGIGVSKKIDNWNLLEKFFKKKGITVSKEAMEDVIHCKQDAAARLVESIYTFLTNRTVRTPKKLEEPEEIPAYARVTASYKVKEGIKDSEVSTTMSDQATTSKKAEALIREHEDQIAQDRVSDPQRYHPKSPRQYVHKPQAVSKPLASGEATPAVFFRDVQVKPVNRSAADIRASQDGLSTPARSAKSSEFNTEVDGDAVIKSLSQIVRRMQAVYVTLTLCQPICRHYRSSNSALLPKCAS
uniref:Spermatogenesis-associated protein 4 n=1 Tax=Palpitomonas bilix TaxID=652834 RepID=A0A7S3D4N3_9EUKA|mmetsp:Transcript_21722/g.56404  ORF Transcript_21722/g.56404 Transcript_21722/m.56404 type:complete len:294 (+) Transcript_21722:291-1172(+)